MKKPNENTNLQVRENTRENEEMMDVVRQMRSQGWQVEVCDTPVPYFTDGVSAGYPRECGDYDGEMMALPPGEAVGGFVVAAAMIVCKQFII